MALLAVPKADAQFFGEKGAWERISLTSKLTASRPTVSFKIQQNRNRWRVRCRCGLGRRLLLKCP
jgi:hypothetical protein